MAIGTSLNFTNSCDMVLAQQEAIARLAMQQSSGKRMLNPSDDPLGAASSINLRQAAAMNDTFATNRARALDSLGAEENTLQATITAMQSALERVVYAGNGSVTDTDRRSIALDLQSVRDALMGHANARDGNGTYLFSGYDGGVKPFNEDGTYAIPNTTSQQRMIQVGSTRSLAAGDVGSSIFARANPGSQGYIAAADLGNKGTASFSEVSFDPKGVHADRDFAIAFTTDPTGAITYEVNQSKPGELDTKTGPFAYTEGAAIDLGGAKFTISGVPANGDIIKVEATQRADVNVFKTLDRLIGALNTPASTDPVAAAALKNELSTANRALHEIYDNISTVESSVGTRVREIESLDKSGSMQQMSYVKQISDIENINIVSVISELELRRAALMASTMAMKIIQQSNIYTQS
jgi:flagellar hook-associated protein 3 FlgL